MLSRIRSAAVLGIDAFPVEVEVDISNGLPSFSTVGLPNGAVKEGRERVSAALANAGFQFPLEADHGESCSRGHTQGWFRAGSADRPGAAGGQRPAPRSQPQSYHGPGRGRPGGRPPARSGGPCPWPWPPAPPGVAICFSRRTTCPKPGSFRTSRCGAPGPSRRSAPTSRGEQPDSRHSRGLERPHGGAGSGRPWTSPTSGASRPPSARSRSPRPAAHNILLIGPPGAGKTMLARRLPTILPSMTLEEALETTKIHSVAGLLAPGQSLCTRAALPGAPPHHQRRRPDRRRLLTPAGRGQPRPRRSPLPRRAAGVPAERAGGAASAVGGRDRSP